MRGDSAVVLLANKSERICVERIRPQLSVHENLAVPWQNDRALRCDRVEVWRVLARLERDGRSELSRAGIRDGGDRETHRVAGVAGLVHDQHAVPTHFLRRASENLRSLTRATRSEFPAHDYGVKLPSKNRGDYRAGNHTRRRDP